MLRKQSTSLRSVRTAKMMLGTVVALGLILSGCGEKPSSNAGGSSASPSPSASASVSPSASASPKPSASASASPAASASPKPSTAASASPAAAAAGANVAQGKTAVASTIWKDDPKYEAAKAVDGDPATRWSVNAGDPAGFLQVDLGKEANVAQIVIREYKSRITGYTIQVSSDGKAWTDAKKGTKDAADTDTVTTVKLDKAVKAKFVKLKVDSMSGDPSIYELEVTE